MLAAKLGREASVFDTERSYDGVLRAIRAGTRALFPLTIEFFPQEGKYHHDGHRACGVAAGPGEAPVVEELVSEDLLVEEISIDGMCGVY